MDNTEQKGLTHLVASTSYGKPLFLGLISDYWILAISLFVVNVLFMGFNRFSALYLRFLGASPEVVGFIFATSTAANVLLYPFGGYASDMFGRKKLLILGPIIGFLGLLALALAENWQMALLAMILATTPGTFVGPAFQAYVADVTPKEKYGRAYGILSSIFNFCWVIGPLIMGFLLWTINYRVVILLVAIFTLAGGVSRLFIREAPVEKKKLDWSNALRNMTSFLKNRELRPIIVIQMIYMFAGGLIFNFLSIYWNEVVGYPENIIGILFSIGSAVGAVVAPIAGHFADKYSKKVVLTFGLIGEAFSVLFFVKSSTFWQFFLLNAIWGGAIAFYYPVMDAFVANLVKRESRGSVFGSLESLRSLAYLPGPAISGFLWVTFNPTIPFYACTMVMSILVLYAWFSFSQRGKVGD